MAARRRLAEQLKAVREDAELTATKLAELAGWHGKSKVSKIESATRPISVADLRTWCQVCGVPAGRTAELVNELRAAQGAWTDWRRFRSSLRQAQTHWRSQHEQAQVICSYRTDIMPGMAQTLGYVTALMTITRQRQGIEADDVPEAAAERIARQHILYEPGRRFLLLIEEAVLYYRIGGAGVLAGQLHHLLDVKRLPSVSLGIIPMTADRSAMWPVEPFVMFDQDSVVLELVTGALTLTDPREVSAYLQDFNDLLALAVHGHQAAELIRRALERLALE